MKEEYARMVRRTLRADTSRTAPPVTADSIARAKQHQADERQRVFQETGVVIQDEPPYLIHCPRAGCRFTGSARTDGGAVRSISAHLVSAHLREVK